MKNKISKTMVSEQVGMLQALINTLPAPIFYKDGEGKYTGCNRAFENFMGMKREEIIGKKIFDMAPASIAKKSHEKERELYKQGGVQTYEWKMQRRDGTLRDVILHKAAIVNNGGTICGLIGIITDVTAQRRAIDELKNSLKSLSDDLKEAKSDRSAMQRALKTERGMHHKVEKDLNEAERKMQTRIKELTERKKTLDAALKEIMSYKQEEKESIENNVLANVLYLVMPYVQKLKNSHSGKPQNEVIHIIEMRLNEIISPFANKLSSQYYGLTPKEIEVANLIKQGMQDKDIIEIINISPDTVKTHRKHIRQKLGIYGKRINLRTKLHSFTKEES
jgi:PAS domain S-box-containing protein